MQHKIYDQLIDLKSTGFPPLTPNFISLKKCPRGLFADNCKLNRNFSNSEANLQQLVDNEPLPGFPSAAKSNSNLTQGKIFIWNESY